MPDSPLISVVITYYSYAQFLTEAVASLSAQTYKNIEVIIVDDGSPEKHAAEIDFGGPEFPIRIIAHETNKGLPEARNTGIMSAAGEFLVIMDSDDMLEPTFLAETLKTLQESAVDGVYTQVRLFESRDYVWKPKISIVSLLAGEPGPVSFLISKEAINKVGGYQPDLPLNSDHEFWVKALSQGLSFACVDQPLFKYRKHEMSMSCTNRDQWWQSVPVLINHHKELYDKHYPEILAYKERQFRLLEQQYDELYQQWAAVDSDSKRVHAIHKEALNRIAFADRVFKNPILRAMFFFVRRLPNSQEKIAEVESLVSKPVDRAERSVGPVGDTRRAAARR